MEIPSSPSKQTALLKPASLADKKEAVVPESDIGGEKNDQVAAQYSVRLSQEAIRLSQAPTAQANAGSTPIKNGEQARKAAEQVVFEALNNPGLAKGIHGNLSQVKFKLLLE